MDGNWKDWKRKYGRSRRLKNEKKFGQLASVVGNRKSGGSSISKSTVRLLQFINASYASFMWLSCQSGQENSDEPPSFSGFPPKSASGKNKDGGGFECCTPTTWRGSRGLLSNVWSLFLFPLWSIFYLNVIPRTFFLILKVLEQHEAMVQTKGNAKTWCNSVSIFWSVKLKNTVSLTGNHAFDFLMITYFS